MTVAQTLAAGKTQLIGQGYEPREAQTICSWLMEEITGLSYTQQHLQGEQQLLPIQWQQWQQWLARAAAGEPVQYILGKAWFCGMEWKVSPDVLIPRPETEQLVHWIAEDYRHQPVSILDIGTGSGCIAISLQQLLPQAQVFALDSDEKALQIARENAAMHASRVRWIHANILTASSWSAIPATDVVVSNPPYVLENERDTMPRNVVLYEPAHALFVPSTDPLLFYRAIAQFMHSKPFAQQLYVEVHEAYAEKVAEYLQQQGFTHIEIRTDWFGKNRMIRASLHASTS
ncbi:MAG: peptide chain release factor N(5)-glutamine methyltransferase [Thermoflavifilum sp.]|nr:peptide chain release factor N(5)-glutamine methyltransferase [Thermoflavifilum sp.]